MTHLNIGDLIEVKGVELQIYAVKFHYSAEGISGSIDLIDPFIADRWKDKSEAKKQQTALFVSGNANKVIDDIAKTIDS
jgi:hypothetical protein